MKCHITLDYKCMLQTVMQKNIGCNTSLKRNYDIINDITKSCKPVTMDVTKMMYFAFFYFLSFYFPKLSEYDVSYSIHCIFKRNLLQAVTVLLSNNMNIIWLKRIQANRVISKNTYRFCYILQQINVQGM